MFVSLEGIRNAQHLAEQAIDHLYHSLPDCDGDKVDYFSSFFRDCPYELTALGEGIVGEFDQYPLYRVDAFDCQTYVETVLALAWSESLTAFIEKKVFISYGGHSIDYFNRTHFICLDWCHLFQNHERLIDITKHCASAASTLLLHSSSVIIDRATWYQSKTIAMIRLLEDHLPEGVEQRLQSLYCRSRSISSEESVLTYIACSDLFQLPDDDRQAVLASIPSGSVMQIIRSHNTAATHVQHLGFVIHEHGRVLFRHASSVKGKVIDELCEAYLQSCADHSSPLGVVINQVVHSV